MLEGWVSSSDYKQIDTQRVKPNEKLCLAQRSAEDVCDCDGDME